MDANNFQPISSPKFFCEFCDFKSSKLCNWKSHLLSTKHQKANKMLTNANKNSQNSAETIFTCECGKKFIHNPSLSRHKKKCLFSSSTNDENIIMDSSANEVTVLTNLVLELVKSNGDLQKQMLEVCKNGTHNTINNNSNNKSFNLNFFLNETCKDAMNIMDFVDSIKIQLCDIESIGELGFVNGMSKLIIKNLKALDENMRPVHCNDPKRDSLYVKDANVWEKEDSDNKKIKKAIKYISHKNICAIPEWKAKYPDCIYSDSKKSNQYNHIVVEAMGGPGDNDSEKADKIVKKIAKEVTIDKSY
jgi:hypothetical protein